MLDDLQRVAASVASRRGWDFDRMRFDRDPAPWEYDQVVRGYLSSSSRVLDIGTGGGERFLRLCEAFGEGLGIDADPEMIRVAEKNLMESSCSNVSFRIGDAFNLPVPGKRRFDVVLNRQAPFSAAELARVVVPDGYFITQQVGSMNTANICAEFGCGPSGDYDQPGVELSKLCAELTDAGFLIRATGEYNVPYFFVDLESFLFWLKAIPIPYDFDISEHEYHVKRLIEAFQTARGIETNEHRVLVVAQKPRRGGVVSEYR